MKLIIRLGLVLSLAITSTNIFSQTALDEKYGFQDFKLGESYSKWSSNLTFFTTLESGINVYKYTGSCCKTLYGYQIEEIRLGFDREKDLTVIWFTTEKFQKGYNVDKKYTEWNGTKDFDYIKNNMEQQFGKASGVNGDDNSGKLTIFWLGTKTMLNLEYDYLGTMNGDRCNVLIGKYEPSNGINDGF